jgi:hypothetical protein
MNNKMAKNQFFGINKFPKGWGIVMMPISMSRIATGQSAQKCIEWILDLGINKVNEPKIGLNLIYGDFLYLLSNEKASSLKELFMIEVIKHKNALQKLVLKNKQQLQIQQAFRYQNWNDIYLNSKDFDGDLRKIRSLYKTDTLLQKYIDEDIKFYKREKTEDQINFLLEENLATYLLLYKQINIMNEYVLGREEWILWAYPGVPGKALVYLFQKNPFNLKTDNPYLGQYNLENSKFYEFSNFDLDTWDYR